MEELPVRRKSPSKPEIGFIGSGTYNCVLSFVNPATGEQYAFRISVFPAKNAELKRKESIRFGEVVLRRQTYQEGASMVANWPADRVKAGPDWLWAKEAMSYLEDVSYWAMEQARLRAFLAERGIPPEFTRWPESFLMQYRARAILNWMQLLQDYIGPALLRTPGPWRAFSHLQDVAKDLGVSYSTIEYLIADHCGSIEEIELALEDANVPYVWVIEKMEMLAEWKPTSDPELRRHIFALMWFFMTMGSYELAGFRHHDLKPDNLLTRRYSEQRRFRFELMPGRRVWEFDADTMGVVIDLDFATLDISSRLKKHRESMGTLVFAPPEASIAECYRDERDSQAVKSNSMNAEFPELDALFGPRFVEWYRNPQRHMGADGYDQWSLGLVVLAGVPGPPVFFPSVERGPLQVFASQYAAAIMRSLPLAEEKMMRYLFRTVLIACAVHNVPAHDPFGECPRWFPSLFFEDQQELFGEAMETEAYQRLVATFHENDEVEPYLLLLAQLFAWEPKERMSSDWLDDPLWEDFLVVDAEPEPTTTTARWPPPGRLKFTPKQLMSMEGMHKY